MNTNKLHKINQITPKSIELPNLTQSSINSPKIQPKSNSNAHPNLSLSTSYDSKKGFIQFNMMRIMPNNIPKDKEILYQENIKLKQQIKFLNSEILKLKTRISIVQKETNKMLQPNQVYITKFKKTGQKINRINKSLNNMKNDSDKLYTNSKIPIIYLQNQNNIKNILRQSKDQQINLKNQNQKLKKCLKYTQTYQLCIQNQYLYSQCYRLTKIIQKIYQQKKLEIKQYQKKLDQLKIENYRIKNINIFFSTQLRDKIIEIDSIKKQLNKLNNLEQKYQKQLLEAKKTIQSQKQTNQTQNKSKQIQNKSYKKNIQKINQIIFLHDSRIRSPSKTPTLSNNSNQIRALPSEDNKSQNQQIQLQQLLKQTISYRFKYHRYTFDNLITDIQKVNISQFNIIQMKALLTHQPFYLSGKELQTILFNIYGQDKQNSEQKIKIKQFLSKIQKFIIPYQVISEDKELQTLKKWKKIIRENERSLRIKYAQKQYICKEELRKIMIETQIKDYELELLLSEASIISKTMKNINFQLFLNKILE